MISKTNAKIVIKKTYMLKTSNVSLAEKKPKTKKHPGQERKSCGCERRISHVISKTNSNINFKRGVVYHYQIQPNDSHVLISHRAKTQPLSKSVTKAGANLMTQ